MSSKKEAPAKGPIKNAAKATKAVGQLIQKLLVETDKTYPKIVDAVLADQPAAKTTARSVASIACNLRKNGIPVAMRRSSKKEI